MTSIGDVWLVDFGEPFPSEPAHTRPALVVGPPSDFGRHFPVVIVAPMTTTHRRIELHVEIEPTALSGLSRTSYVQPEGLRSVAKTRLIRRIGKIDPLDLRAVRASMAQLLELSAF
ncbi:MAG: type II toxin-antitoxin system PemK/MazF family toxin [Demequina sp.]|jgi:mRNA interferase MazF|nr:type II toxin-antitoxin system PemK/MazF family toxin [Demequina sp.]